MLLSRVLLHSVQILKLLVLVADVEKVGYSSVFFQAKENVDYLVLVLLEL
jgi:hypothetical protein